MKKVLDLHEITNLTICGIMTHMCVDTTVRSTYEKGYKVKLVAEGCTTKNLTFNNVEVNYKEVNISYFAALARFP
nr:isochorismatase family protein [Mesoplasma melaleucae]